MAAFAVATAFALLVPSIVSDSANAAPPTAPTLIAPTSGAITSGNNVGLSVRAEDPDGGDVNVTFLGRRTGATTPTPGTADPFTLVVLPDTQNYTYSARQGTIAQQAQWVVDERDDLDIAFVSQLGDLVSNFDNTTQWGHISTGLKILDDAEVPNSVVAGNHDFDNATGAVGLYDQFFPPSRYSAASWTPTTARYGGYLGENLFGPDPVDRRNMDNFSLFSAGGRDFLVLSLEWEAPAYALDWGRKVLAAYPDRTAIFVTHSFVNGQGGRRTANERQPDGTSAQRMWSEFVYQQCSIGLVLSGHEHAGDLGEAMRVDENRCGNRVPQILTDYQDRANGGDGWLRYYTFSPATNTMSATTYSPKLGRYETDADSQFTVPFPLSTAQPEPFTPIGSSRVPAGGTASVTWAGLDADRSYEWKAVVDDGGESRESSIWRFSTPPPSTTGSDTFTRSLATGWGSADSTQPWTLTGPAQNYSVSEGAGRMTVPVGSTRSAILGPVSTLDTAVTADFAISPGATGGGVYASVVGRVVGADHYRAKLRIGPGGALTLSLVRFTNGAEITLASAPVTGVTAGAGQRVRVRLELSGISPTTIRSNAWLASTPEPAAWRVTATDSNAVLQKAGAAGLLVYVSSTAAAQAAVQVDDFSATQLGQAPPPPNIAPTASFGPPAIEGLSVRVNGSSSADPDGSVASWAWSFGDGGTAQGAMAEHVYGTGGTYSVTLVVTDDDGASATASRTVVIVPPPRANVGPTAVIATPTTSGRTVALSGSGSSDPDGSVVSWNWTFGDGNSASGATTTHQYATDGTYLVTLTVADDDEAQATSTRSIMVSTPPPSTTIASDGFTRTSAMGLGTADVGGPWTVTGAASRYSVAGGSAQLNLSAFGTTAEATLSQVSSAATNLRADVSWNRNATAGTIYGSFIVRRATAADDYRVKVLATTTNRLQLQLVRRLAGVETTMATATVGTLLLTAGTRYTVVVEALPAAAGGTTVQAKLFVTGTAEPGWTVTARDSATALQTAGGVGINSYLSSGATAPVTMTVDDLRATRLVP